jgi:urea carboxylase
MEGPGGYQFVGRTVPMWNRFRTTAVFEEGRPWLLRFFDQIRFYEVGAEELLDLRGQMLRGEFCPGIEETTFDPAGYRRFLQENAAGIDRFRTRQQAAFAEERERWREAGLSLTAEDEGVAEALDEIEIPEGCVAVESPMGGAVWKVNVREGQAVANRESMVVLEAMKMELAVEAPAAGVVRRVLVKTGETVGAGEILAIVECC